jgi:hypothetical protein
MTLITVEGTIAQQQLVYDALAKCTTPIEPLLTRPVRITFGVPKNVPGTDKPAWGYTSGRHITLNEAMAKNRPERIKYVCIHELGHALDADLNNGPKRLALMALMSPAVTKWNSGKYSGRGAEAFADAFAEAEGFASPLDAYYSDVTDLAQMLAILKSPTAKPEEPGEPPPTVDPKDIVIAELRRRLSDIHELSKPEAA